jgi:hypothetical protein
MAKTFTDHPQFMDASRAANESLRRAAIDLGLEPSVLDDFEPSCNRIVDDLTRLLLRAVDLKARRAA